MHRLQLRHARILIVLVRTQTRGLIHTVSRPTDRTWDAPEAKRRGWPNRRSSAVRAALRCQPNVQLEARSRFQSGATARSRGLRTSGSWWTTCRAPSSFEVAALGSGHTLRAYSLQQPTVPLRRWYRAPGTDRAPRLSSWPALSKGHLRLRCGKVEAARFETTIPRPDHPRRT